MTDYALSDRAIGQLNQRYRVQRHKKFGVGRLSATESQLGAAGVHYAQPAADHLYLSQQDYTTIGGATIENVVNDTGVTLLSGAWYLLWKADDNKWYSKPAQYDQCNPENPIV